MKPTLSIIIVSYNTCQLLKNCLDSVFKDLKNGSGGLVAEVIVIDNHSRDDSIGMIRRFFPQIRLILNKKNLGFAKANNQGIKKSRGKFVFLLNSDTVIRSGALLKMVNFLKSRPQAGAIGPKLLNSDGSNQPSAGRFPTLLISAVMLFKEHFRPSPCVRGSFAKIKKVDWVMGAAIMIKKRALKEAGLLDENIFMYMEEVEFCYRLKKAGWQVYFYPHAEITHLGRASSKTGKKEPILNIYKGLLYFYKKHLTWGELMLLQLMLKIKAFSSWLLGVLIGDKYLKETYGQAFGLS
jgi:GT2 family glycosyltransferase